jgi:transcriptional regulator with XRE-family HTH domain
MKRRSQFKTLRDYVDAQPRRVTQNEIAERLGVSPSTLSNYLRGHRVPDREQALHIARNFSIDLEGLLDPSSRDDDAGSGSEQSEAIAR